MKISFRTIRRFALIIFLTIILSGASVLSYIRVPRIWLCGILGVLGLFYLKSGITIRLHTSKLWMMWIAFLFITIMFSYVPGNTLKAAIIYLCFFLLAFLNYNEEDMLFLIKIIRICCIIFALSILISVLIPNLFTDYFPFLIATNTNVIRTEISEGIYSGLAGEKSNAAFYMNIAIALELAMFNLYKKLKIKNYIYIAIYIIALMLTGKRTLLFVSFLVIGLAIKLFNIKSKPAKIFLGSLVAVPIGLLVLGFIPQAQIVIKRIIQYSSDTTYNGRKLFWDFCLYMFRNRWLIGYGYDTFNEVFGDIVHYIYDGALWNMYAHNIYYELLAETGVVGFTIFVAAAAYLMVKSIKCFKGKLVTDIQKFFLFFSIAIQMIFLVYGVTGNVIYAHYGLGFYFAAFIIYKTVVLKLYKDGIINSVSKF